MRQIPIGTCIPGDRFEAWAPKLIGRGFECFAICFHMSLGGADLGRLAERARELLGGGGAFVSALGYYCNPLQYEDHRWQLESVIDAAPSFGAKTVSTFAGALEGESVEAAIPRFRAVFGELARRAEDRGVGLAIENCPMGGTWRKNTCNIAMNPRAWELLFDAVPSGSLGLEWEPAHQICQFADPMIGLGRFAKRILHVHGKDALTRRDELGYSGIEGPVGVVDSRFPGFGDTDWRRVFAILQSTGYAGAVNIEGYHDPLFGGDWEMTGQLHALSYLKWCRGGDFAANPWEAQG